MEEPIRWAMSPEDVKARVRRPRSAQSDAILAFPDVRGMETGTRIYFFDERRRLFSWGRSVQLSARMAKRVGERLKTEV